MNDAVSKSGAPGAGLGAWRSIITHVEPGEAGSERLRAAVDLARRCDSLLIGVGAEGFDPAAYINPYGYGGIDAPVFALLREASEKNLQHAREHFEQMTPDVTAEWRSIQDRPAVALARVARAADVIVAGGPRAKHMDRYRMADTAELVIASGLPVLVAPFKPAPLEGKRIVVAWKDAREARRAVAAALPMLQEAEAVLVVEACDADAIDSAERRTHDVAAHLVRHGVAARSKAVVVAHADGVANALQAQCREMEADVLVAGCYGRSRANEWWFGGATRDLLSDPQRFLLLAH